jgi:hypothetical protein
MNDLKKLKVSVTKEIISLIAGYKIAEKVFQNQRKARLVNPFDCLNFRIFWLDIS